MPFIDVLVPSDSDLLRLVELTPGGHLTQILDLENGQTYIKERDTFTVTPGPRAQRKVQLATRRGGENIVGETHQNGTIAANWLVKGTTADECLANVAALLAQVESERPGRFLEWRPAGATRSTLYRLVGPGVYTPKYSHLRFSQLQSVECEVQWPVGPSAYGLPMDIADSFNLDSRDDYVWDQGSSADYVIFGALVSADGAGDQHSATHARGYGLLEPQATMSFGVNSTQTGQKAGVKLRVTSDSFLHVYVDDIGTNSRLRIDKVLFGTPTNMVSTNLPARVSSSTTQYVRGRIEGSTVFAEHFNAVPTPLGTPTTSTSASLTGIEPPLDQAGLTGWTHTPVVLGDSVLSFESQAFVRRNVTLPATISWVDEVPGDLEAEADLDVTHSGGAAPPVFALASWNQTPPVLPVSGTVPFGLLEAESSFFIGGWSVQADASARSGSRLNDTAAASADNYFAFYIVDPSTLEPDPFEDEVAVEVWGRVLMVSTLITPKLTLTATPATGFSAPRLSLEYPQGRFLVPPSSGSVYRLVKLGTVLLPTRERYPFWLGVNGTVGIGSSGSGWGLDYLTLVRQRARMLSPTGRAFTGTYPQFLRSTSQLRKVVASDLQGYLGAGNVTLSKELGLGGSTFEPAPGPSQLLVKLSSLVPDDPTSNTATEQLSHAATVHQAVQPRFALARP